MTAKKKILIVDDEIDLRLLLAHELASVGYDIQEASDGAEAIELLKVHHFDLALLDIQMPSVNGIQVLKYIKEHTPDTKAIMLTGYADLKHAMEAKEYGAGDFIAKPYKISDITSTLERLLKK